MWRVLLNKYMRNAALWLFWPAVALITWGELTPHPPPDAALFWDKAEHFTAYMGLAGMATLVIGIRPRLVWVILGLMVLGGALEILQGYTGRDSDIYDEIANIFGATAGMGLGLLFLLLFPPRLVAAPPGD